MSLSEKTSVQVLVFFCPGNNFHVASYMYIFLIMGFYQTLFVKQFLIDNVC